MSSIKVVSHVYCLEFDGKDAMQSDVQEEYGASHRSPVLFSTHQAGKMACAIISIPHLSIPEITVSIRDVRSALNAIEVGWDFKKIG